MPNIHRVRIEWSGGSVTGPGLTTFYTDELTGLPNPADFAAFFTALIALVPQGVQWQIPNGGDTLDVVTGQLVGTWTNGSSSVVTATGGSAWAAGVGARIVWRTGIVRGGHRVRGSTFICPMVVNQYDTLGTIGSSAISTITAAADALRARAVPPIVWSRPRPSLGGGSCGITDVLVPDKVSWLRSRRT